MEPLWVYIGTSTNGKSRGIYRFQFDPESGTAEAPVLAAETARPTFLAFHPTLHFLYAVNAVADFQGEKMGAVSSFALDRATGELTFLNQQPSGGAGPCHLSLDAGGKNVLVANYVGGSVAVLPIEADGRLVSPSSVIQHSGSSADPNRQEGPHAHSIILDQANRYAFAADLGLDQVLAYRFDAAEGLLTPHEPLSASMAAGAGPRHLAFHPSERFLYVINELNSTVTAFRYDAASGVLDELQTVPTLPTGFSEENYPSEALVHPSGKVLYGSNRGHDSIAIFQIGEDGTLTPAGHQPSGGKWPRNFALDPSGTWMIVGNQDSDNVLFFRVDGESGALTPAGQTLEAPIPICFRMVPVAG